MRDRGEEDTMNRFGQTTLQVLALMAAWWVAEGVVRLAHLPLPAGVVGLAVLSALLLAGWLPASWIASGARWLVAEMLLFFIPPVIALVQFGPLLRSHGLQIGVAIAAGSLMVMAGTGLAVERALRFEQRLRARREACA